MKKMNGAYSRGGYTSLLIDKHIIATLSIQIISIRNLKELIQKKEDFIQLIH